MQKAEPLGRKLEDILPQKTLPGSCRSLGEKFVRVDVRESNLPEPRRLAFTEAREAYGRSGVSARIGRDPEARLDAEIPVRSRGLAEFVRRTISGASRNWKEAA